MVRREKVNQFGLFNKSFLKGRDKGDKDHFWLKYLKRL